ncbi:hypothetical protein BBO99_00003382 [Phytophthora kernoviae]|uniref:Uncharacterized protein n=2 Tax=Phytophthora kernoviae TaxID=325452 RepID=A0A3R7JC26_9STRA|nr:hypothetical protein G195_004048 [Phytophthora kernoviae 00238/432]KAG2528096.1 hypothetical protein JM16_003051 [Phytophthora kernoviae]KAG2529775.1 hypothetical protein JM18_002668 [Phytophthora kernoviae]RLN32664.1 hypothetical protein BBI17_002088 [Phytophthora kernoviae]RLN81853.1 hypothetical protein BBO99_00003382 [Phytophthora kernoviae]
MEAEEEEREVATASAALFGGAEGETHFDDDGMDGSELPSSFTMPLLTRDEEEDADNAVAMEVVLDAKWKAAQSSIVVRDAQHPVWEVGGASFTEVVDGARLKIVATGHSMVADAKITVAQASAAHAAVVINTIKEVVTASLTVVDLHALSRTAPRNKYNGISESASDDAVRMVESHDAL